MYTYKSLESISYREISECFNLAFSDYQVPVRLTEEQLEARLTVSGVDKSISFGAFYNEQLVGFILNSCNEKTERISLQQITRSALPIPPARPEVYL